MHGVSAFMDFTPLNKTLYLMLLFKICYLFDENININWQITIICKKCTQKWTEETFRYYNNTIVSIFYPFSKMHGPFEQYKAKIKHSPLKFCLNSSGLEWRWNIPGRGTSIITSSPSQGSWEALLPSCPSVLLSFCPPALPVIRRQRGTRVPPASCNTYAGRPLWSI